MAKKMINTTHIEGLLYQHDLALKVSGETSKNPGTPFISGVVEIATDNAGVNIVPVHFTYVTATTKNGRTNDTFTVLKNIIDNVYKTGLYIKSNVIGVGTVTYQDENIYGALGHVINYGSLNKRVEIKSGLSFFSDVTNFIRSKNGNPGSKSADIKYNQRYGTINMNTKYGIYGYVDNQSSKEKMEIAKMDEVFLGHASIYTTNIDDEVLEYDIKILEINPNDDGKNFYFEVTDPDLLEMSGGIVQGMSGSPIIQNNKIIGAVTRVLVDDVKRGYGISIVTMLEEGDKLAK
jgi:stage IV sporulation protein B